MNQIELVKTPKGLRGWTEDDQQQWLKFKGWLDGLEPGEFVRIGYVKPRNIKFHRRFFALLKTGFDAWEPRRKKHRGMPVQKNFERFRKDALIAAGFYDIVATASGGVKHEAHSISFANMDDNQFATVYSAVADVLLQGVLTRYTRADLDQVVDKLMRFTQ
jgi:hypothetical protein